MGAMDLLNNPPHSRDFCRSEPRERRGILHFDGASSRGRSKSEMRPRPTGPGPSGPCPPAAFRPKSPPAVAPAPARLLATPRSFFFRDHRVVSGRSHALPAPAGSVAPTGPGGPATEAAGRLGPVTAPLVGCGSGGQTGPAQPGGLDCRFRTDQKSSSAASQRPFPSCKLAAPTHGPKSRPGPVLGRESKAQFRKHQESRAANPDRVGRRVSGRGRSGENVLPNRATVLLNGRHYESDPYDDNHGF